MIRENSSIIRKNSFMNKKKLLIILISLAVIILLAVILIVAKKSPNENISDGAQQDTEQQSNSNNLASSSIEGFGAPQDVAVKEADPEVIEEEGIKTFAKTFYERYGSFSSDNNYESFDSLRPLMTEGAIKEMEVYIEKLRNKEIKKLGNGATGEFYGVTTKVLSVKVEQMTDLAAKVSISYQKQEIIGDNEPAVSYGNAEMEMIKKEGVWEVEGIDSEL